jgi:hypothetical protein
MLNGSFSVLPPDCPRLPTHVPSLLIQMGIKLTTSMPSLYPVSPVGTVHRCGHVYVRAVSIKPSAFAPVAVA